MGNGRLVFCTPEKKHKSIRIDFSPRLLEINSTPIIRPIYSVVSFFPLKIPNTVSLPVLSPNSCCKYKTVKDITG